MLDNFGYKKKLPSSVVHVDEDFHYMRGKQDANDDSSQGQRQSWPSRSIFKGRNPDTLPLNATLSQTCKFNLGYSDREHETVERLKEVLFEDMFLSRKKYLTLQTIGRRNFYASIEEWDCCECDYQQFSHYDDILYISKVSREYYKATCPSCALKISSQCDRFWGCCMGKMRK